MDFGWKVREERGHFLRSYGSYTLSLDCFPVDVSPDNQTEILLSDFSTWCRFIGWVADEGDRDASAVGWTSVPLLNSGLTEWPIAHCQQ